MPLIDLVMLSIMSFDFLNTPDKPPYTIPGIKNMMKISGTIDFIMGADKAVNSPFSDLNAESMGKAQKNGSYYNIKGENVVNIGKTQEEKCEIDPLCLRKILIPLING